MVAGPSGAGKSSLINALRIGKHRPDQQGSYDEEGTLVAMDEEPLPRHLTKVVEKRSACVDDSDDEDELWSTSREKEDAEGLRSKQDPRSSSITGSDGFDKGDFLVVGELSKMGRGMHTTTSAKLIRLPGGGLLADTPGEEACATHILRGIQQSQFFFYFCLCSGLGMQVSASQACHGSLLPICIIFSPSSP